MTYPCNHIYELDVPQEFFEDFLSFQELHILSNCHQYGRVSYWIILVEVVFIKKKLQTETEFLGIYKTYLRFTTNCVEFRTILWSCRKTRLFRIELTWKQEDFSYTLDQRKSEPKFQCKNCFTSNLGNLGTLLYFRKFVIQEQTKKSEFWSF